MESLKNKVFLIFVLIPLNLYAFGKTGHRIIGEVAQRHLGIKAQKGIEQILGNEKLSHASLWADEIKSDRSYDYAKIYHRMDVPRGSDLTKIEIEKDSIIYCLVKFEDILRSTDSSPENKKFALKFILHLLGDLHQPLHIGYSEDQGGNDVRVKWFQKNVNLHQVWDEELILFEELSFTEYADKVDVSDKEIIKKIQTGTYLDWAIESNSYLPLVYDFSSNKNLGYEYHYKVKDTLYGLLQKGGLRLASTLNNIFENSPLTDSEKELRKKLGL